MHILAFSLLFPNLLQCWAATYLALVRGLPHRSPERMAVSCKSRAHPTQRTVARGCLQSRDVAWLLRTPPAHWRPPCPGRCQPDTRPLTPLQLHPMHVHSGVRQKKRQEVERRPASGVLPWDSLVLTCCVCVAPPQPRTGSQCQ